LVEKTPQGEGSLLKMFCAWTDMLNCSAANHGLCEVGTLIDLKDQRHLEGCRCQKIGSPGLSSIVRCCRRYSWDERKVIQITCKMDLCILQRQTASIVQVDTHPTPPRPPPQNYLYHPSNLIQHSFSQLQSIVCPLSNLSLHAYT
jgi:hypothetical protein